YGSWSGRSFEDVCAREPNAVAVWLNDPAATPHGGESILRLMQRVADWLQGEQAHHRRSIVVTHPAVIRAVILCAIGAPAGCFWRIDLAPRSAAGLSGAAGRWTLSSAGCAGQDRLYRADLRRRTFRVPGLKQQSSFQP